MVSSIIRSTLVVSLATASAMAGYSLDKSSTTNGGGTWGSILQMDGSISGNMVTFKVKKQSGTFSMENKVYLKVGSYEEYGANRASGTLAAGNSAANHTHDLSAVSGYPKEFYWRVQNAQGGYAWVGPLKVSYTPDAPPPAAVSSSSSKSSSSSSSSSIDSKPTTVSSSSSSYSSSSAYTDTKPTTQTSSSSSVSPISSSSISSYSSFSSVSSSSADSKPTTQISSSSISSASGSSISSSESSSSSSSSSYAFELDTDRKELYVKDGQSLSDLIVTVSGGTPPYRWQTTKGSIKYLNSTNTMVQYVVNSVYKQDDVLTVEDATNKKTQIPVYIYRGCRLVPEELKVTIGKEKVFTIIGCPKPYEAFVSSGEAKIVSQDDKYVTLKTDSGQNFTLEIINGFNETKSNTFTVIQPIKASPSSAHFKDFSGASLSITISGGVAPFSAVASIGQAVVSGSTVTFSLDEFSEVYGDQTITITDAEKNSVVVNLYINQDITISPTEPKVAPNESIVLSASFGSGNYTWSVKEGTMSDKKGESILYTAPKYATVDTVTVTDDTKGKTATAQIVVGECSTCKLSRSITTVKGWNLLSIPVALNLKELDESMPPAIGTASIKNLGNYDTLYLYKSGTWEKNPKELNYGVGFWLKTDEERKITFEGTNYAPSAAGIQSGWTLLGSGKALSDTKTLLGVETVYSYKNGIWDTSGNIEAGEGFWVKK